MQNIVASIQRRSLVETLLMTIMAVSFVTAFITGIFLNSAHAAGDFVRVDILRLCHATSAIIAIALGVMHMWRNRSWYHRLCTTRSLTWKSQAQNRLLTVQTVLFIAMIVSGIAVGCGMMSAVGFHQGCGLIFALLVLVHMSFRLTSR